MHAEYQRILNAVTDAYIAAVYFTDTGDSDQPPTDTPLSRDGYMSAAAECAEFLHACDVVEGLLSDYINAGRTWDSFGHDYWLTRNGHGAGFWDRGMGELGDKLTEQAKRMGEIVSDLDDNGELTFY